MTANTWDVDVDGVRHTITVETNREVGRSMIRVDGRIAAKPLTEDETERVIAVGTARYVIRRVEGDAFDLDIPPEAFLDPAPATPRSRTMNAPKPEPERRGGGRITKIVVGVVATLFVIGLIRIGHEGLAYRSVPWQPYQAADGSFKVNFAGEPKQSESELNISGDIWKLVSLRSQYRNHFYAVQYIDTHMVMTQDNAAATLKRFFDSWSSEMNAKEVETDPTTILKNPAIRFSAVIPKGTGTGEQKVNVDARMKGLVAIREKRIFVVFAAAAKADPITSDREKFIESFEVVPPAAPPEHLSAAVDAPPQEPAPVKTAAPASTADETLGATVARVYADADTKTYWPVECAGRPPKAYPLPKSLAVKQGFQLAGPCAK